MDLSIIIVNWNTKALLLDCLKSVFRTIHDLSFEVWVVDNGSTDGSVEAVGDLYPDVHVIENRENLGFAVANNRAFQRMRGRYALLLNTDATLTEGAADALHAFMEATPEAGMACGQLLNTDGSKQHSFAPFPSFLTLISNQAALEFLFPRRYPGKRHVHPFPIEVDSCIGACMILRREALEAVEYFDERYFFFLEETDLARMMRQRWWRVFFVPDARIVHGQGKSVGGGADARIMFFRSRYLYLKKWHPKAYPLLRVVIGLRLLANTCLTLLGLALTLGFDRGLRRRLGVYLRLISWHLGGCP